MDKKPFDFEKVGGRIHRILNLTLYRKLTPAEYKRIGGLIGSIFNEAQKPPHH